MGAVAIAVARPMGDPNPSGSGIWFVLQADVIKQNLGLMEERELERMRKH